MKSAHRSSPKRTTQSSRGARVSGQAQQIFRPDTGDTAGEGQLPADAGAPAAALTGVVAEADDIGEASVDGVAAMTVQHERA